MNELCIPFRPVRAGCAAGGKGANRLPSWDDARLASRPRGCEPEVSRRAAALSGHSQGLARGIPSQVPYAPAGDRGGDTPAPSTSSKASRVGMALEARAGRVEGTPASSQPL
jgi:hypothetical protein